MSSVRSGRSQVRGGGLPQDPRSRSVGRERSTPSGVSPTSYKAPPLPQAGLPRQIRPQRSLASIPSRRVESSSDEPSRGSGRYNTVRTDLPIPHSVAREESYPRRSQDSYSSSSSSSGSSLLDRMKSRSGYNSSRTSLESNGESDIRSASRGGWLKDRAPVQVPEPIYSEPRAETQEQTSALSAGYGYSIWNRVAEAASGLTVNVSKAWAVNIATYTGEETPPGQESRLTRAIKAYHLEKARHPSDLPDWLFDEHERRPIRAIRGADEATYNSHDKPTSTSTRGRGLREIYDRVEASSKPDSSPQRAPSRSNFLASDPAEERSSRATDRLKSLRDARRTAAQRSVSSVSRSAEPEPPSIISRSRSDRNISARQDDGHRPRTRTPEPPSAMRRAPRPAGGSGLPVRPGAGRQIAVV